MKLTLKKVKEQGFDASRSVGVGRISVRCSQCNACVINGVACHEHGCPNMKAQQVFKAKLTVRWYEKDL